MINDVCILANRSLLGWQVEAMNKMVEKTGVNISLVVVNETKEIGDPGFAEGASPLGEESYNNPTRITPSDIKLFFTLLCHEGAWTFVLAEKKLSWMLRGDSPDLMKRHPVTEVDVLSDADHISCRPIPVDGDWCDLPDTVVDRVVDETDVVIRFGFNLLTGRIISEPKYGVLSFHPGDIRKHRGIGPAQPFVNGESEAGATLQQLTNELDGGNVVVIMNVDISDAYTLGEVRNRVNKLQIEMLSEGIARVQDQTEELQPSDKLAPYVSVKKRRSPRFAFRVLRKNMIGRAISIRNK